jgi:hypothetical protein
MRAPETYSNQDVVYAAAQIMERIVRAQIKVVTRKMSAAERARFLADLKSALRVIRTIKSVSKEIVDERPAAAPEAAV